jgi:hypothetical protein
MSELKKQTKELEEAIKKEGDILIAMVHPTLYGPLRGLNFILKNPKVKELDEYLLKGCESISTHVWEKTKMAVRPMVLPKEMIAQLETPAIEISTIAEGEAHIRKIVAEHTFEKDPWYFRSGIL